MRKPLTDEDLGAILLDLERQNDRSAAIVATTIIEDRLRAVLTVHLPGLPEAEAATLFEERGPLYTFDDKIQLGRALGIYGPITQKNLNQFRLIRNVFAHVGHKIDFISPEITAAIEAISVEAPAPIASWKTPTDIKGKFILSTGALYYHLSIYRNRRQFPNRVNSENLILHAAKTIEGSGQVEVQLLMDLPKSLP